MGVAMPSRTIQLGLNFAADLPELFASKEMGEDALRVLGDTEIPLVRAATRWSRRISP